jgi:AcrR family transcriptional regulator
MYRMARAVKGTRTSEQQPAKRSYDASRRQEAARRTRARILEVARERFLADGYAATTLASIAADAEVSVETINKAFRNKAGVLKAIFDVAVAGDDEPVAIPDRPFVARIEAEPVGRRKLEMYTEHLSDSGPRAAPVELLIRAAAGVDAEIAAVWRKLKAERLNGMGMFAAHLVESGVLREGVSHEEARDVLWTCTSSELYEMLVLERGWSVERWARFVCDTASIALLPPWS